jgi:hypothetical protein
LLAKKLLGTSLFCHEASANKPIQVKNYYGCHRSKDKKMDLMINEDGLPSAATGSGSLGGKKAASLAQRKPNGQRCQGKLACSNKGDKARGSPSASKTVSLIKNRSLTKGQDPSKQQRQGTWQQPGATEDGPWLQLWNPGDLPWPRPATSRAPKGWERCLKPHMRKWANAKALPKFQGATEGGKAKIGKN